MTRSQKRNAAKSANKVRAVACFSFLGLLVGALAFLLSYGAYVNSFGATDARDATARVAFCSVEPYGR